MRFSDIKGNADAVSVLRSMADSGRIPHAMLFYENPRSGGLALAMAYLQYINCEHPVDGDSCGQCPSCRQMAKLVHPDVHFVFPVASGSVIKDDHPVSDAAIAPFRELFISNPYFSEQELYDAIGIEGKSGNISVYEARSIIGKMSLSSIAGGFKSVVMFLPERMNVQAANKLLKMLEEPPQKTLFILITQSPEDVMSTIFSRCQGLRVLPFDRSQLVQSDAPQELRDIWERLAGALSGRDLYAALQCADEIAALGSREKQKAFCTFVSEQIRRTFLYSKGLSDIAGESGGRPAEFSTKFCVRAAGAIDRASMLIGRNVYAKLVFTDLVNRLFVNL